MAGTREGGSEAPREIPYVHEAGSQEVLLIFSRFFIVSDTYVILELYTVLCMTPGLCIYVIIFLIQ